MTFTTDFAEELYRTYAERLPLIDYHNHLSAEDIAENRTARDPEELWVRSDPYKHRLMRICGVPERMITGDDAEELLFETWCTVLPHTVGNPVYDWSVMELETYFGITEPVGSGNAAYIRGRMNDAMKSGGFGAQDILGKSGIAYTAPCASVTDGTEVYERKLPFTFVPSLRLDPLLAPDGELSEALGVSGGSVAEYFAAIEERLDRFARVGCRIMDIALDDGWRYTSAEPDPDTALDAADETVLSSAVLRFLGRQCMERKWKLLLHIGAVRETSRYLRRSAGKAGGFAAIGGAFDIRALIAYFRDVEDENGTVPSTLLFSLNPSDNASIAVLTGSFSCGQIGVGSPWWWNDHRKGMKSFFDDLSSYGVLSSFFGMTTDSRSVLSTVRHDYFRRVLCGWIGDKVKAGELPDDLPLLGDTVERMCWYNAARFFDLL